MSPAPEPETGHSGSAKPGLPGSSLKRNVSANLLGKALTALLGFAFIPLYIRFLGMEAYGLIGLFATITALCAAADCGLSATANRELARLSVQPGSAVAMRDLVRTLEAATWVIAGGLGLVVVLGAPFIAEGWVQRTVLSSGTVQDAIIAMGFALMLQWPVNFYSNAIIGLQDQVALNLVNVGVAALRGAGAVVVLWALSSTIEAFLAWQIVISASHVLAVAVLMWRRLPASGARPRVHFDAIRHVWRFAAGMSGLTLVTLFHAQVDKIILSQILPLALFGYYTLAWAVASSLYMLCYPIVLAFLPHMAQLVSLDDRPALSAAYHKAAQIMSVAILPAAIFIVLFAPELLLLWTRDAGIADKTAPLVALLVAGTAFETMASVPVALQWAYGWTSVALWANLGALAIQIPLSYVLAIHFGAIGGASVWLATNAAILVVSVPLIHRRLLRGELKRWLVQDLLPPFAASSAVALCWRLVGPPAGGLLEILFLAITAAATLLAAAIAVPLGRRLLARTLHLALPSLARGAITPAP